MSDAYHHLCDMSSMFIGLIVNYIKKVNQNKKQSNYFLNNIDSITSLITALLLQILAITIFIESGSKI